MLVGSHAVLLSWLSNPHHLLLWPIWSWLEMIQGIPHMSRVMWSGMTLNSLDWILMGSDGNSKWHLKYSSLLINTVFFFLYIFFYNLHLTFLFRNLLWFSVPTVCLLAWWLLILHEWHIYLPVWGALLKMPPLLFVVPKSLNFVTSIPLFIFVPSP